MKTRKNIYVNIVVVSFLLFTSFAAFVSSCSKTNDIQDSRLSKSPLSLKSLGDTTLPYCRQGDSILTDYLISNFEYPLSAQRDSIEGRIIVLFTVNADSTISNISILHGIQTDCDNEALRVVRNMPPFNPATTDGIPISYTIALPIMLRLTQ